MRRLSLLLLLLLLGPAHAETAPGAGLNTDRLTAVYTEALSFVAPRILDPVPIPRLTVWGLRGLTALDSALLVDEPDKRLRLLRHDQVVLEISRPTDESAEAWAGAAVRQTAAGYDISRPLRHAGTQGLIQCFFEEMFSRIDSYSRYIPPAEAGADRATRAGRAGLGLTVRARGAMIEVQAVVRDSPASIAGIKPGDLLVAIDGQRTRDQDIPTINAMLSGEEGSAVTLTWRGRDGRTRDIQLVRVMVPPETMANASSAAPAASFAV